MELNLSYVYYNRGVCVRGRGRLYCIEGERRWDGVTAGAQDICVEGGLVT